ncbi:hypothetical protein H2200_001036 [Cladophialophora chaetospira]|uniref:Uncharacterized protein n=1 Tax=Cladophialophora chaetospira TaxID=386627 RepID=A0AA38XPK2_9EURO|nr:hypothetical protein H2200_001036 [Cladophialophora chaetospira]
MASALASPRQFEFPYEDRLAPSLLLFDIYAAIDHELLSAAQRSPSPVPKGFPNTTSTEDLNTDMIDVSEVSDQSDGPEEIAMHIVLAETLQYVQLLTFGSIISPGALQYSLDELVVNLKRYLASKDEGVPSVRASTETELDSLTMPIKTVLGQLDAGNRPLDPLAVLYKSSSATASYSPSKVSYPRSVAQQPPKVSNTPHLFIRVTPSAISAVWNARSADSLPGVTRGPTESIVSNDGFSRAGTQSSSGSSLASYASCHEYPSHASERSFSNCSIAPSESATNIPSRPCSSASNSYKVGVSHRRPVHRRDGYTFRSASDCSNAPNAECYAVRPRSATGWTEIRRTIAFKNEEAARLQMFFDADDEEMTETTSYYTSAPDYSSSEEAASSPPNRSVVGEPRLALGMGSIESVLGPDATEAERVEYALDMIDRRIDLWFAQNKVSKR